WVPALANPFVASSSDWQWVMSKLSAFRLPARRVVYLDADAFLLRNVDELFAGSAFNAVADPGYHAAFFNSGLMVLSPSQELYQDMLAKLYSDATLLSGEGVDSGDQGFLNWYFGREWGPETSLPGGYNTLLCEAMTCDKRRLKTKTRLPASQNSSLYDIISKNLNYEEIQAQLEAAAVAGPTSVSAVAGPTSVSASCGCHLWRRDKDPFSAPGKLSVLHMTGQDKPWRLPSLSTDSLLTTSAPAAYLLWRKSFESANQRCEVPPVDETMITATTTTSSNLSK
ncbi:unnamed protein product, partial [Polarella glacialis]